jgi:hypothetical protein
VIRDVVEFRRHGLACRRVAELNIPVDAWRAAMRHAGRHTDTPVHTFLLPPRPATAVDRQDRLVYAVRTDPPPDVAGLWQGLLWWRRVDELTMPLGTVRTAMHRFAHAEGVRLHTFLAPTARATTADPPSQLIYAVWAQHGPDPFSIIAPPRPPPPRPVTHLAAYTARRCNPSAPDHHSPTVQPSPPQTRSSTDNPHR